MAHKPEFPTQVNPDGPLSFQIIDGSYPEDAFRPPAVDEVANKSQLVEAEHRPPTDPSPEALQALTYVSEGQLSIHALTNRLHPEVAAETADILAASGIQTDAETPDPGDFRRDYRPRRKTERQFNTLKDNAKTALENVDDFKDAAREGRLGPVLTRTFGAVQEVTFKDTYIAKPEVRTMKSVTTQDKLTGKIEGKQVTVDGIATIGKTEFTVGTEEDARLLHGAFRGLSRTARLDNAHDLPMPRKTEDGRWVVSLTNLNEYSNRMMEEAVAEIVAEGEIEAGLVGTTLPGQRMTPSGAKKAAITYHPRKQERIDAVQQDYDELQATMKMPTYRDGMPKHEDTRQAMARKPEVLTRSPAAVFEATRKHMNAAMKYIRGDGSRNQQQHPDKQQRLIIEDKVDLLRAEGRPGEAGPPAIQARNPRESMIESAQAMVKTQRKHPVKAALKLAAKGIGAGLIDSALDAAAELGPRGLKGLKHRQEDKKAWHAEKEKAATSQRRVAERSNEILDRYLNRE